VTLSPGQTAVVEGHLQGASPNAPGYVPALSDVCVSDACDTTTLHLRLPEGERGDLTITAAYSATATSLAIRIFDATGALVRSTTSGGIAVTSTPSQGAQAIARGLPAGIYTAQLYLGAGVTDFTETIRWSLAR
jgi:hypothetical protein